ncbi:FMRFamide receptor, partial [Biomphalaria glabrata]
MMDNSSDVKFNLTQSDPDVSSAVSDDVYIVILIVTNVLIANILSLLGIVGSILNIIILSHHKMQDPTNVVFLAISVCDFIFSVTQISFNFSIASFLINFFVLDWAVTIHVISFDRINYLAVLISIHLVTLVSIERMVA